MARQWVKPLRLCRATMRSAGLGEASLAMRSLSSFLPMTVEGSSRSLASALTVSLASSAASFWITARAPLSSNSASRRASSKRTAGSPSPAALIRSGMAFF